MKNIKVFYLFSMSLYSLTTSKFQNSSYKVNKIFYYSVFFLSVLKHFTLLDNFI